MPAGRSRDRPRPAVLMPQQGSPVSARQSVGWTRRCSIRTGLRSWSMAPRSSSGQSVCEMHDHSLRLAVAWSTPGVEEQAVSERVTPAISAAASWPLLIASSISAKCSSAVCSPEQCSGRLGAGDPRIGVPGGQQHPIRIEVQIRVGQREVLQQGLWPLLDRQCGQGGVGCGEAVQYGSGIG